MKLTQAEIEATVKQALDKRCWQLHFRIGCAHRNRDDCVGFRQDVLPFICSRCMNNSPESREIAQALIEKERTQFGYVPPREATDAVTNEQALAGLKVEGKHGS